MDTARHTCLKLQLSNAEDSIFVKGTWFDSHFDLFVTDGQQSWICNASEEDVSERASQWDQPVSEYIELAERYLGFQQPGSVYGFADAGDGSKRLSWTFEREGTKLEWRWKCQPSPNSKKTTAGILDFLMDANIRLSEEVFRKTQSFERLKVEAEMCLAQSEMFNNEKMEFESAIYAKFLAVLNSKKAKLRELRDQLSMQKTVGKLPEEDEEFTDRTEIMDDESEDKESDKESPKKREGMSKDVAPSRARGRKRTTRR
ncbi:DNA repair protein XRCC4-like [Tripterygium wilfordii]|uniref:DNA repair protein XRCC4-like n=1 Tax=Tripterygium wilfordii TaxID=458696 RepID=A0A7J7CWW1_TRIWF|nr:DNA repair protein XRCC4-like [Tripterygium wilfordii]XP_038721270.1 DNA repair protein XRCC4-like [Tripterygium wilfordii]KAF5738581.1 DNA repair protein XRCC4-like [Tripterygium wilfordii]